MPPGSRSTTAARPPDATTRALMGIDVACRRWHSLRSLALGQTALLLDAEFLAQQTARIIGHAPQPGLVGQALLALLRRFVGLRGATPRVLLAVALLLLQRALHAFALRGIGLTLGLGVGGAGRLLLRLRPLRRLLGLALLLLAFARLL